MIKRNTTIIGSGILPIIRVNSPIKGKYQYFMLVNGNISQTKKDYFYECVGGKRDQEDNRDLRNTAVRECQEELSHLFSIKNTQLLKTKLSYVNTAKKEDISTYVMIFKCENINTTEDLKILKKQFQKNFSKFQKETKDREHLEAKDYLNATGEDLENDKEYFSFAKYIEKNSIDFIDLEEIGRQLKQLHQSKQKNQQLFCKCLISENSERIGYRTRKLFEEASRQRIFWYTGLDFQFAKNNVIDLKFKADFKYQNKYLQKEQKSLTVFTYSDSFQENKELEITTQMETLKIGDLAKKSSMKFQRQKKSSL